MNENKNRDQIEDKYKWDLSVLYASADYWKEDYRKVEKELPQFLEFKGSIVNPCNSSPPPLTPSTRGGEYSLSPCIPSP